MEYKHKFFSLFLASLFVIFSLNNQVLAQSCPAACDVTIDMSAGGTFTPSISLGANKTLCIIGTSSGAAANFNPTGWTFSGVNNVCFSGQINMNYSFGGAGWTNAPKFTFQSGSVITHTGTLDINSGNGNAKAYIYNYGSYTNNGTSILLKGTELHNGSTGIFNLPSAELDIVQNAVPGGLQHVNDGTITIGKVLDINWGSGSDIFTNNGNLTAQCFYGHNSTGTFKSPSGSTVTFNGTDAGCIALQGSLNYAFDTKNTILVLNGTLNVPNATASFNSTAAATDLQNAKVYVKNFVASSYQFNTGVGCLSIQATDLVIINSGNTYNGLIYIYDKSYTTTTTDNGDLFAGSRFTTSNLNFITLNTPTTKMIYSSTDGSSAAGCPALPVSFINFKAVQTSNDNLITWSTAEEKNAQTFIVERSLDGVNFEAIGSMDANGNSSSIHNYQFLDKNAGYGLVYYRLNEIDKDGKKMYSNIVEIQSDKDRIATLLGNPVREDIMILLLEDNDNLISLYNSQGTEVFEKLYSGIQQVNIKSQFTPGVYLLKVSNGDQSNMMKVIIE